MAQLILTHSNTFTRGIRKRTILPSIHVGTYFLMFTMIILTGLMSFLYLMQFTDIHTKGFTIDRLETERDALKNTQEIKYTNISRVKSLSNIEQSENVRRMIPARNPIYLNPDTALVKKTDIPF